MPKHLARVLAAGLLALVTLGVLAVPAGAQSLDDVRDRDRRIAVGDVFVAEGEDIDGPVVAIDGSATVRGRSDDGVLVISGDARVPESGVVRGDVFVIDGDARISGRVTEDVVVLSGRAIVEDGATVRGDVRSTKSPRVARGAAVRGDVETIDVTGTFTAFGIRILGFFWIAVTVSTAVLGLLFVWLFPRAAQTTGRTGRGSIGKSFGVGFLVAIGVPIVGVLAMASLVGLPFGLGLLGALGVLHAIGYVAGAYCFGRVMVKEPKSRIGAFFAGWAILRVLALIPGIGVLVWIATSVFGIGGLTLAAWRVARRPLDPPEERAQQDVPPPAATDSGAIAWSSTPPADAEAGDAESTDASAAPAEVGAGSTDTDVAPTDAGAGSTDAETTPAAPVAAAPAAKAAPAKSPAKKTPAKKTTATKTTKATKATKPTTKKKTT